MEKNWRYQEKGKRNYVSETKKWRILKTKGSKDEGQGSSRENALGKKLELKTTD